MAKSLDVTNKAYHRAIDLIKTPYLGHLETRIEGAAIIQTRNNEGVDRC